MAKHRMPPKRRARKAVATAAAAAGLSGTLVLGHALGQTVADFDVDLANTVLGVGGRTDTFGVRIPDKLTGDIGRPEWNGAFDYVGVEYPSNALFEPSVTEGAPLLATAITDTEGPIQVTSYSQGVLVAEQVKRELVASAQPPAADAISFLYIASPYLPNGGLFARFPGFRLPGVLPEFGPAQQTPYAETFVTNMYDPYADFPAYFNPLSIANALMGIPFGHGDPYYDGVDLDNLPEGSLVKTVEDEANGTTDTYILVYTPRLALFAPIRETAARLNLTPLTEPMLLAIEPLVRLVVDMGYTDRTYQNADTPTPFSFITPPAKVIEALQGVPGAIQKGLDDAISAGQDAGPAPVVATLAGDADTDADTGADADIGADALRVAAAPVSQKDGGTPESEVEPAAAPEPEPADKRVVRPTLVSDGNKVVPTTTVGTDTPAPTAGVTAVDPSAPQEVSTPAVTTGAEPDPGPPADAGSEQAASEDKAA